MAPLQENNLQTIYRAALGRGERIVIFLPAMESDMFHWIVGGFLPPHKVVVATEKPEFFSANIMTEHQGVSVKVMDANCVDPANFDRFFIPLATKAANYVMRLVAEQGVDPLRVHVTTGVLSYVDNNVFRYDNKYADIAKLIPLEGGLMTGNLLLSQIFDCIHNIARTNMPGDIVNLGVFKGWTMKYFLLLLDYFGLQNRRVIGFDTFDGFVVADKRDVCSLATEEGRLEAETFKGICVDDVAKNLLPHTNFDLVKGDIAQTLKGYAFPRGICLTLFDMDDYSPTAVALPPIYDNTVSGGFFVHDHYMMVSCHDTLNCIGQRIAMDEFLKKKPMFNLSGTNVFIKN